jgi:L-rhamnose mutarotase
MEEALKRLSFKFQLNPNMELEYKKRHDEIWDDLLVLLKKSGIQDYSIFFDEETNALIGILKISDQKKFDELPKNPLMQKWWKYMADIMATNADNSPKSIELKEVFYMK